MITGGSHGMCAAIAKGSAADGAILLNLNKTSDRSKK
jgi:NAD(P)-dependent dehydrogenase (short-subunit alcohol dehydrogenase family)